ncbi:hypothetical protein C0993_006866 [Termitomyces sp. T159_Od127]|nr:hypothetical protein C0993_006866 [Termitomyces sp. T159_Od127]
MARSKHEWCSISRLWQASCIAAEQGWLLDWVREQMKERSRSRAAMAAAREGGSRPGEVKEEGQSGDKEESSESEREEPGPSMVIRVGPPHGKRRPSEAAQGKRQASPPPEAGPSKRLRGNASMAGLPEIHIFSPTSARPQPAPHETMEQSLLASTVALRRQLQEAYAQSRRQRDELATTAMDQDRVRRDWDVALAAVREREVELGALWAQVAELESRVAREVPGEGQAVEAARAAEQESVRRWDWALLEAALSWEGVLCWAWEHRLLLDGASAAHALLREGVGRMPFNLPAELDIGMAQLDILLVGHRRRNAIAPRSWLDVAVDTGEGLPVRGDHLASLAAQMETAMSVTGPAARGREGNDEEGG